jgi:hypothetical protein
LFFNINYTRLDTVYQKRLIADDLDERFFLKERLTILTHLSPDRDITVKHLP